MQSPMTGTLASTADADRALSANQMAINRDLGLAGMNLSALQGDQATALTARGQNNERDIAFRGQDVQTRDQDRQALTADAEVYVMGQLECLAVWNQARYREYRAGRRTTPEDRKEREKFGL